MQRSKQQALMFLLGAVLVGGALGFTADRYIGHEKIAAQFGPRNRFYDELGLSPQQRSTLDSLAFVQDCAMKAVFAPHDSLLKSMRTHFRAQRDSVFTKEQKVKLDQMAAERSKRMRHESPFFPSRLP